MKRLAFASLIALLFTACESDDVDPNLGPATNGHYNLYVSGDRTGTYENGEITFWNPGSNGDIIVLGPEKVGEGVDENDPVAMLTLGFYNNGSNGNQQDIFKISLLTKEMSMGTPEEVDQRLFEFDGVLDAQQCVSIGVSGIEILETGENYIKGAFCFRLKQFGERDTVRVHGDFTAVKFQ